MNRNIFGAPKKHETAASWSPFWWGGNSPTVKQHVMDSNFGPPARNLTARNTLHVPMSKSVLSSIEDVMEEYEACSHAYTCCWGLFVESRCISPKTTNRQQTSTAVLATTGRPKTSSTMGPQQ